MRRAKGGIYAVVVALHQLRPLGLYISPYSIPGLKSQLRDEKRRTR